jgi:hypothetical protein
MPAPGTGSGSTPARHTDNTCHNARQCEDWSTGGPQGIVRCQLHKSHRLLSPQQLSTHTISLTTAHPLQATLATRARTCDIPLRPKRTSILTIMKHSITVRTPDLLKLACFATCSGHVLLSCLLLQESSPTARHSCPPRLQVQMHTVYTMPCNCCNPCLHSTADGKQKPASKATHQHATQSCMGGKPIPLDKQLHFTAAAAAE